MKVDLHVHTKYSNRPTNFFLKKLNAPESLTDPAEAYALAKRRGMGLVTFTDTDSIGGCLELAHHPDVFCSCETIVAFPEDDCKIKLLVFDLNETQLAQLLAYRGNIFNVRDYLAAENLLHAVASPIEILNNRLNPDHIERLLLMFDHFETRCGGRHERTNGCFTQLLDHLTPELMRDLQKKWKIDPASDRPWQKGHIGGSNDYCGQYVGLTWTETVENPISQIPNPKSSFLTALRERRQTVGGMHGTTMSSAHSMYRVAFSFYQESLQRRKMQEPDLLSMVLTTALQPGARRPTVGEKLRAVGTALRRTIRLGKRPSAIERRLMREFLIAYRQIPDTEKLRGIGRDELSAFDAKLYALADRVIGRVSYRMFSAAAREFNHGRVGNAISYGAAVLPLQAALGPYLYSYQKLNRDRKLIAQIEERFSAKLELPRARGGRKKIAWFSDTVTDVNGVSLTLHRMAEVAEALGEELTIICSLLPEKAPTGSKFLNFEPVGEIAIPDYELQKLVMPPGLQMLKYLENAGFTEYVISTPGPVGLIALAAAKMFNVPTRAIYHSDFPQHVRHITGDEGLEQTSWAVMRWFYLKADAIYSPSAYYRDQLADHGFPRERMFIFHRGTDLEFFNPRHRDERFFDPFGLKPVAGSALRRTVFVYTGRVSREKNLDVLLDAFVSDPQLTEHAALAIVGDGPYREELLKRYANPAVLFPGFMKGKSLAQAYASSDVFVFPSTTDTYGNSVLEAQASGLPALVTDEGGPKEIIAPGESGLILPGYDVSAWRFAMRELVINREKRERMANAARAHTAARDWTTAFREFWDENPYEAAAQTAARVVDEGTRNREQGTKP